MTRSVKTIGSRHWRRGKAKPKALANGLQYLPGDLVTNDADDEDRAHELDPPHIVKAMLRRRTALEQGRDPDADPRPPEPRPDVWDPDLVQALPMGHPRFALSTYDHGNGMAPQDKINAFRLRSLRILLGNYQAAREAGLPAGLTVWHLWFPQDDTREYFLRAGPPPPDCERPKHLRGLNLVVDPEDPALPVSPDWLRRRHHADGIKLADLIERTRERMRGARRIVTL